MSAMGDAQGGNGGRRRAAAALVLGAILLVAIMAVSRGGSDPLELLIPIDDGIPNVKGADAELDSYNQILSFGPGVDPAANPNPSDDDMVGPVLFPHVHSVGLIAICQGNFWRGPHDGGG